MVHEEIDEVMFEARQPVVDETKLEEAVGDLLFATVNLARHLGTKAAGALQKANRKFEASFRKVEAIVTAQGLTMEQAGLEIMGNAWEEVKHQKTDI